jgi:hypothetical protein
MNLRVITHFAAQSGEQASGAPCDIELSQLTILPNGIGENWSKIWAIIWIASQILYRFGLKDCWGDGTHSYTPWWERSLGCFFLY